MKSLSHARLFVTPWTAARQATPSMGFPGKNTGVGCHFLLQGIFLTQGSNPDLLHCRQTIYHLSHQRRISKVIYLIGVIAQSCLTLCDPVDCSPPGSSAPGIFQAGILEQVAISYSEDLSDPGIEPVSPASPSSAGRWRRYLNSTLWNGTQQSAFH